MNYYENERNEIETEKVIKNFLLKTLIVFILCFTFISGVQGSTIVSNNTLSSYALNYAGANFPSLFNDRNTATYWQQIGNDGKQQNGWFALKSLGSLRIDNYYISSYDATNYVIVNATFQGSTTSTNGGDGTWTTLDTISGSTGQFINHTFINTNNYTWYRVNFSKWVIDTGGAGGLAIREFWISTYDVIPLPLFVNQTPSDITSTNSFQSGVSINFNFSGFNSTNNYLTYGHIGMNTYINGTLNPTYINKSSNSINGNIVNYRLSDNEVYGYTSNYDSISMDNTPHSFYTITGIQDILKIEIMNLSNTLNYNILEIMLNSTSNVNVFMCNSTYTTGQPSLNSNCALVQSGTYQGFNHSVNNSRHNIFSIPVVSRNIGSVNMTSTMFIVIRPLVSQIAQLGYINGSVRNGMFQISNNNGNSYTSDNTKIPDVHVHQYLGSGLSENLTYYACDKDANCSTTQTDNIGLTLLPPSSAQIQDITDKFYNETFNITWFSSNPMFSAKINSYNISLLNNSFDTIINLGLNKSAINIQEVNTTNLKYGYYYIKIVATDNNSLTSTGFSNAFLVSARLYNPCNISIVSNSSGVNVIFNYTTNNVISNSTIRGKYNNVIFTYFTSNQGNELLTNLNNGIYYLYFNETFSDSSVVQYDSGCTLGVCVNSWYQTVQPCSSNLKLISYSDLNLCSEQYDVPVLNGTYEDCSLPPNTDKGLWLLIFVILFYLVLLIMTIIYPLASVGLLIVSIFTTITFLSYMTTAPVMIGLLFPIIAIIVGGFAIILRTKD